MIPVLVDGAPPPRRGDLPEALATLARRQSVRLEHTSFGAGMAALMTALERALQARMADLEDQPQPETTAPTSGHVPRRDAAPSTAPDVERQLTGHTDWVVAVATAQVDGRPVVISGGGDQTVRVWDLATGNPVGTPFTGHTDAVFAVATAQLDGRPVVISGSATRRCGCGTWPPATRSGPRSPATPTRGARWRPRSWTGTRW